MISSAPGIENLTLNLTQEIHVRAPLDVTFAALLEQIGPANDTPDGQAMAMKLEAWPGGRWYRDLGDGNGHFWGVVQAIKKPTLLEITGPLFMSYPVVSNVQYRLSEADGVTLSIDLARSDLLLDTEVQRFAEALRASGRLAPRA